MGGGGEACFGRRRERGGVEVKGRRGGLRKGKVNGGSEGRGEGGREGRFFVHLGLSPPSPQISWTLLVDGILPQPEHT